MLIAATMANLKSNTKGSQWSFKGTTALVTSETRGIKHAMVDELAEFGASVYTCSRNEEELDACLKEWKEKGFWFLGLFMMRLLKPKKEAY